MKNIILQDGNYSYDDLNYVIKKTLENNDDPKKTEISFINSQNKGLVSWLNADNKTPFLTSTCLFQIKNALYKAYIEYRK